MNSNKIRLKHHSDGFIATALTVLIGLGVSGALLVGVALALIFPKLPDLDTLTDYRPKVPLRVLTTDGVLIGEFGEERRRPVDITEVPLVMQQAILAAEDDRFYEHGGIDWVTQDEEGSKVMMGMSTTRKTMDFEKEYEQFVNELNSRAAPKAASAGDAV